MCATSEDETERRVDLRGGGDSCELCARFDVVVCDAIMLCVVCELVVSRHDCVAAGVSECFPYYGFEKNVQLWYVGLLPVVAAASMYLNLCRRLGNQPPASNDDVEFHTTRKWQWWWCTLPAYK